ncbi:MAG: hypothetical protein FWC09_00305 [Lachnospiraceae bacterium]|nr:hypothetical protein [Lachnospiraceae bacterium]
MYDIFRECVEILKNYTGARYLFFLYLAAVIYLLFAEKEKRLRALIIYAPLTILFVFLMPLLRWFYIAIDLDQETYYRILWLLPMGITIAYAGCKLFAKHRCIGLIVTAVLIALCGTLVYRSPHITRAENLYNIPTVTINVCDFLLADAEFNYINAAFPKEHIHFVRQYTTDISLAYGRAALVERWGFSDHPVYQAMEAEIIDIPELLLATREREVNYIIIHLTRVTSDDPENYGLVQADLIDGFLIYRDEVTADVIREKYGPYLPKRPNTP